MRGPGRTTSVTMPMSSASSASTIRPVRIRSSARPMPTIRGSRCVPPSISGTPQRRSGKPSVESLVTIRRSHHSASSSPPARHQPEIAAIVGFDGVSRVKPNGPASLDRRGPNDLDRLEVGARAEGDAPGAGDDEHPRVVVGLEARGRPPRAGRPSGRRPRCAAPGGRWSGRRRRRSARSGPSRSGSATSRPASGGWTRGPWRPSCGRPCACRASTGAATRAG